MQDVYWIPRHYIHEFCRQQGQLLFGRILDFGCGSKPYASCFPFASEYVGLEFDKNLGRGEYCKRGDDYFYDGFKIPFPDNSFDAIVSFQVIEHVRCLENSLAELRRVSRPGAKLLITGPLLWPEHETPCDFRRLTRWGISQVIQDAGLKIDSVSPLGSVYDVLCVFMLDYFNTHRSPVARRLCKTISPIINLLSVVLNKLDPWAQRKDRYCYLDLGLIAINPG